MTPRTPEWRSVRPKLRSMLELLEELQPHESATGEQLRSDRTTALVVERVLTVLVELAFSVNSHVAVGVLGRAPDTYADSFGLAAEAGLLEEGLARQLTPSARMRNVLVHMYLDIDYDQVAAAVPLAREQYGRYVRQVAGWFDRRGLLDGAPAWGEPPS